MRGELMNRTRIGITTTKLGALGIIATLAVTACGGSESDDTGPASGNVTTATFETSPVPLDQDWKFEHFTEPVLEPDARRLPYTEVPKNQKGELLPAGSEIDEQVMWQAIGCQAIAFSTDAGPTGRTAGGWPTGWTQDEKGAALAAWSIAILFEVMPDRDEFTRAYLTGDTGTFAQTSAQRDPRSGVRAQQWNEGAECFRSSTARRVDFDTQVWLSDNNTRAAVRSYVPEYDFAWDFPLVWDSQAGDWKATAEGFTQYWRTTDDPTSRTITPTFSW